MQRPDLDAHIGFSACPGRFSEWLPAKRPGRFRARSSSNRAQRHSCTKFISVGVPSHPPHLFKAPAHELDSRDPCNHLSCCKAAVRRGGFSVFSRVNGKVTGLPLQIVQQYAAMRGGCNLRPISHACRGWQFFAVCKQLGLSFFAMRLLTSMPFSCCGLACRVTEHGRQDPSQRMGWKPADG